MFQALGEDIDLHSLTNSGSLQSDVIKALEKDHMYSNGRIINTPVHFLPQPVFPGFDHGAQQAAIGGSFFGGSRSNGDDNYNEVCCLSFIHFSFLL